MSIGLRLILAFACVFSSACNVKMNNSLSDGFFISGEGAPSLVGVPAQLVVVSGNAQSGPPSTQLSAPIVIRLIDFASNPVANETVNFVVTSGGGSLSALTAVTDAMGLVQVDWTLGASFGVQGMSAFMSGVPSVSLSATATGAGIASQLAFATQPSAAATAGANFATQPVLEVQDVNGDVVTGSSASITLAAYQDASCTTPATATFSASTNPLSATSGVATFSGVNYSGAETIYLRASAAGLTSTCSNAIAVSAGAATQLAFSVQPSTTATAAVDFATQAAVQVRDAYGNLVSSTASITLAAYTDAACTTTPGLGTLSATTNPLSATAGTAAFAGVDYTLSGTIYLRASSAGLTSACSNAIAVSAGAATQLAFSVQPSTTATAGTDFATQPSVQVRDAYGNLVSSTASITLAAYTDASCTTTPGLGTLSATTNPLSATAGTAAFGGVDYTLSGTVYLRASSAGLASACSNAIAVSAGAATQLVFSVQPSTTATAAVDLATQPSVQVRDAQGNLVSSTASITLAAYTDAACTTTPGLGTLSATTNPLSATAGTAAFGGVDYTLSGTIYLRASSAGLTSACSNAIAVSAGAATQLAFSVQPSTTATAGTDFATQPSVQVRDAQGNLVSSTASITLAAYTDAACTTTPGLGTLSATTNPLSATAGTSAFTGVDYTLSGTIYLRASSAGLTSACSNAIAVSAGAATQLAFSVQPSTTATAAVDFATQPAVQVRDAQGNLVNSTASITLAAYTDAACTTTPGLGTLSATTNPLSATAGTSAFAGVDYTLSGTIYLRASSAGLTSACSNAIAVSAGAATQLAFSVQPSTTATAAVDFATQPAVQVRDAQGNLVNSTASITLAAYTDAACTTTPGLGTLSATTNPLSATAGTAAFAGVDYTLSGTIYLRASSAGLTSACSNAIAVSAGAAATLAKSAGDAQSGTVGQALTNPIVAIVRDANNNPVSGVTVNFAVTGGGGSLSAASAVTNASGLAQVTWTLGTSVLAAQEVTASSAGLMDVVFTATPQPGAPAKLVVSGPATLAAGACSPAFTITRQDQYDNPTAPASATAITTGGRGGGNYSLSSTCSPTNNAPSIASGQTSVVVYFRNTTAQSLNLTFASAGLTGTNHNLVVSNLFLTRAIYNHAANPEQLAAGDFNRDGNLDIASPTATNDRVNIFLGNPDGTFQASVAYETGDQPRGVKVADLNRDGFLDLVVTNWAAQSFSVLLGNGDGTFQAKVDTAHGGQPLEPYLADFNRDGHIDMMLSRYGGDNIQFYRGNGDGTFAAAVSYPACNGPLYFIAEDFDTDGDLDVITSCLAGSRVSYFANNGNGTFATKVDLMTDANPGYMASGDFNGDGNLDFAVSMETGVNEMGVFLGNGNGTFQARVDYTTGTLPLTMVARDFNGDGNLDILIAARDSDEVNAFFGNGNGTFQPRVNFPAGDGAIGMIVGDLNHDGELDFAVNSRNDARLSVFLAAPRSRPGTFSTQVPLASSSMPIDILTEDYNRDGRLDLAVLSSDTGAGLLRIHLGNGDGTFGAGTAYGSSANPPGDIRHMVQGDFNRDGELDIAVTSATSGQVSVSFGNGAGAFGAFTPYNVGSDPRQIVAADFDRDGDLDLVVANRGSNTVSILRNNGAGVFAAAADYAAGTAPVALGSVDNNGDGRLDLVVGTENSEVVGIMGNGDGTFAAPDIVAAFGDASDLDVIDINRDGNLDLVVAHGVTGAVSIYWGAAGGGISGSVDYAFGSPVNAVGAFDLNQDGRLDLVCTRDGGSFSSRNGDAFTVQADIASGMNAGAFVTGDFNRDGVLDFAISSSGDNAILIHLGQP